MKEIYIVLTHTGTILSKIIKNYTKDEFSHCSISLDIELSKMYSFGRLNPYNAFIGGFVHEYIDQGTFKRFYKTKANVYALKVTEEQYEKVEKNIMQIQKEKESYKFNVLGLLAAGFHKKIGKEHSFYCAEFVKYVIENAGIKTDLPKVVKPEDFKNINGLRQIYSGLLKRYRKPRLNMAEILEENILTRERKEETV